MGAKFDEYLEEQSGLIFLASNLIPLLDTATEVIQGLVFDLAERIIHVIPSLLEISNRKTVKPCDLQTAVRLLCTRVLAPHAISEGQKTLRWRLENKKGSQTRRSNLTFPVPFFKNLLNSTLRTRVSWDAAAYLTAVVEYVGAEILELATNECRNEKLRRVSPRHVLIAIRRDVDFSEMFTGFVLGGGYYPHQKMKLFIDSLNGIKIEDTSDADDD